MLVLHEYFSKGMLIFLFWRLLYSLNCFLSFRFVFSFLVALLSSTLRENHYATWSNPTPWYCHPRMGCLSHCRLWLRCKVHVWGIFWAQGDRLQMCWWLEFWRRWQEQKRNKPSTLTETFLGGLEKTQQKVTTLQSMAGMCGALALIMML